MASTFFPKTYLCTKISFLCQTDQKITVTDDTAVAVYWMPLLLLLQEAECSIPRLEIQNILKLNPIIIMRNWKFLQQS